MILPDPYIKTLEVDFNVIFDTDLGAALYLLDNTSNKSFFEDYIMGTSIEFHYYSILTRKIENPITYLFKDKYKSQTDSIFKELQEKKWDRVLEYSIPTDLFKMFTIGCENAGFDLTIKCLNERECEHVRKVNPKWKAELEIESIKDFSTLYIHDVKSLVTRKWNTNGKSVYLYAYSLNYKDNDIKMDCINDVGLLFPHTQFFFIPPYSDFELPKG